MSNTADMVFYARSARSLRQLLQSLDPSKCAVWIDHDLIGVRELQQLRASGWNITVWTSANNPGGDPPQLDAQWTIQMHHPDSSVWIEDLTPFE